MAPSHYNVLAVAPRQPSPRRSAKGGGSKGAGCSWHARLLGRLSGEPCRQGARELERSTRLSPTSRIALVPEAQVRLALGHARLQSQAVLYLATPLQVAFVNGSEAHKREQALLGSCKVCVGAFQCACVRACAGLSPHARI